MVDTLLNRTFSRAVVRGSLSTHAKPIFSASVDDIPFTAIMVPMMMQMVKAVDGISIRPLAAWALAFRSSAPALVAMEP